MKERGFTLVELIITIVFFSAASLGIFRIFAAVSRSQADATLYLEAVNSGKELLEQILVREFADPTVSGSWGPESGESQRQLSTLDDLDDFDGYRDTVDTADHLGYLVLRRRVEVDTAVNITSFSPDMNLKRIEVVVHGENKYFTIQSRLSTLVSRKY
jgi:prepilin-type N-terminal cleavage/methylation domain-containing protein